jgi:hypothetical protein
MHRHRSFISLLIDTDPSGITMINLVDDRFYDYLWSSFRINRHLDIVMASYEPDSISRDEMRASL